MRTITQEELTRVLEDHKLWLDTSGEKGTRANLSFTNLSFTNLSSANLSFANLSGANLSGATLSGAILENITGKFIFTFQLGKHFGYYCDNYVTIGCEHHTLEYWIDNGTKIGKDNGYTEVEICNYLIILNSIKTLNKE